MTEEQAKERATWQVYVCMTYGELLDECDRRNWKSKTRRVIEKRLIKALTDEYLKKDEKTSKFIVGNFYSVPHLYGGLWTIRIEKVDDHTVTFEDMSGWPHEIRTQEIIYGTDGAQMLLAWEYKGHNCYWIAQKEV